MKHGHRAGDGYSKTYNSWRAMLRRCYAPNATNYDLYGGRGIKVCPQWKKSFETFLKDVGGRPEGMTLDRKDPNGDYTPRKL